MTDPSEARRRQARMLADRAKKRFQHFHRRYARQNIDCFRIYDWDIPEIRAVVDWYAGHLVVGEYTRRQSDPGWLPAMGGAVAEALGVPPGNVHLKLRRAGKRDGPRYERIDTTGRRVVVSEGDLKFHLNLDDFVDTGLFSDHRNTRRMVRQMAAGKDFLNLFCYTASFTCYAARGGARSSVSVDRSETAVKWARENMALNGIAEEGHAVVQLHVDDFLDTARRRRLQFDLAVVDPPSFSETRGRDLGFDVAREHPRLLAAVAEVMRRKGTVFFSTNHQDFALRTEGLEAFAVEEITAATIPEDYLRPRRPPIHRCWKLIVR